MYMIGIYKITSPTEKVYIGQSWNIGGRFNHYKRLHKVKGQRALYNSLIKYGVENHIFSIIKEFSEQATQNEIDSDEKYYISYYSSLGTELLNIRQGGSRGKHSEETKQIIKEKRKFQKMYPHQKEALRAKWLGEKNPNFGKHLSEEIRNKIRASKLGKPGKPCPDWVKKRISEANRGSKNGMAWAIGIKNKDATMYKIQTPVGDIVEIATQKEVIKYLGCSLGFFIYKSYKGYKLVGSYKLNR